MKPDEALGPWPALPFARVRPTVDTVQLWTQVVGKIALVRQPWVNHSWHTALRVSARGLETPLIPCGAQAIQFEFDFTDHDLVVRSTSGAARRIALTARPIADFYAETLGALAEIGAATRIVAIPNEIADPRPFALDHSPRNYEPSTARDFWLVLVKIEGVFARFRSRFLGKVSPIHFFWGSADFAMTRFSGREAPRHPGGIPHLPDAVTREAYSHEVSSAGFWPGDERAPQASFYSYAYPTPPGFGSAPVAPAQAQFDATLGEFLLPYDVVRCADDPAQTLLDFLQSTYQAAADLGGWDRSALECAEGALGRPRVV